MMANPTYTSIASWWHRFWQDQQPTPGRLNSTLRIVLASVVALVLMLTFQMPFASVGLYFIFLVARDNPSISLRSGFISFVIVVAAVAVELGVVILSDNDPMARVLSVAVVTFIGGVIVAASSLPGLGSTFALIFCSIIGLWEFHAPAGYLVKTSLWLTATFSLAVGCAIFVEYLFGARDPVQALEEQRRVRYQALEAMFTQYAEGATPDQKLDAATRVSRLAVAGQTAMMGLYNSIVDRNLATDKLPIGSRTRVTMLAEIMDHAAAFGLQNLSQDDPDLRQRCAHIAQQCRELEADSIPQSESRAPLRQGDGYALNLLDHVESAIHAILTMPSDPAGSKNKKLAALPASKVPFFIPGALRKIDTVAFGLKISFCATLCYIIYHAVDWPGISTSVITVVVTGLSSSGATKQRLLFRLVGSVVGGLILGLGATSFLFPHMDSITSLVILIGMIAFIAAWISSGRKFSYVGLQIAFSFYIVALEGFSAPTELAPARDRFMGILLALGIMWFVFDQLWPVRTVTVMRQTLATVLQSGAAAMRLSETVLQEDDLVHQTDALRDRVGKNIAALRVLNDAVQFEFGVDREKHARSGDMLVRTAVTAAALFWNQIVVLHSDDEQDFILDPGLMALRHQIATQLDAMAVAVVQKDALPEIPSTGLAEASLLESPRYGEYVRNTIARYEELHDFTTMLKAQV
jgi:multidrug resistance protein MdtO